MNIFFAVRWSHIPDSDALLESLRRSLSLANGVWGTKITRDLLDTAASADVQGWFGTF